MTLGGNVTLEVLRFAKANFTYTWSKEGSRQLIQTNSIKPNTLTFKNIKEEDLGYYRCEVKKAGRVVLVLYRALYRHETMPGSIDSSHPSQGMHQRTTCWFLYLCTQNIISFLLHVTSGVASGEPRLGSREMQATLSYSLNHERAKCSSLIKRDKILQLHNMM